MFTGKQQDIPTASGRTSAKLINPKPQSLLSGWIHISSRMRSLQSDPVSTEGKVH